MTCEPGGTRATRLVRAVILAGVTATTLVADRQAPPSSQSQTPPVFQAGVTFVTVDAFPRRDGRVVTGLTKDDFQIFEDGKPQAIQTLEFVHIDANPADADRRDPTSVGDSERQAADPHNRLFVVYLDLAHTGISGSYYTRRPVVDFLNRTIGAQDLFGFMTADTSVKQLTFGRRTESIDDQLVTFWPWGQEDQRVKLPHNAYENHLTDCGLILRPDQIDYADYLVGLGREDELQTSLENLVIRLRDLREARKNILFISEGWLHRRPRPLGKAGSQTPGSLAPPIRVAPIGVQAGGHANTEQQNERVSCEGEVERLESIDFEKRFRDLVGSAARANVAFYPVNVAGLGAGYDRSIVLRELADNTDGFAVVDTNDLASGVRRVSDDLASYYLLGYPSTNTAHDGKYHRIEVRVRSPGVTVSARNGYYAAGGTMGVGAAPAVPTLVADELDRLSRLLPTAECFAYGAPTATGLDVAVELGSGLVAADRWKQGADAEVSVTAPDGASVSVRSRIAAGARGTLVTVPFDRAHRGPWTVSVVVTGDGGLARDRLDVSLPDVGVVGMPMAWRATPSPRSPLLPLADFQLHRNERLHVEWPIVQDLVTRTARLLDRKGQPIGPELPLAAAPADRRAIALDLPMSSLPEGEFLLDLVVSGPGGASERRVLGFRVVR